MYEMDVPQHINIQRLYWPGLVGNVRLVGNVPARQMLKIIPCSGVSTGGGEPGLEAIRRKCYIRPKSDYLGPVK